MPWTTDCLRIAIHHLAKGLHAGSQAKQLEARRNLRQGLKLQCSRRNRSRCSKLVHGVAFLCGITTPSLAAQGEQRRFSYFNIERDNSPKVFQTPRYEHATREEQISGECLESTGTGTTSMNNPDYGPGESSFLPQRKNGACAL